MGDTERLPQCILTTAERSLLAMKWLPVLFALFAFSALAADISGNWKATAEGPNGAMERTFTFKQEGTKVTGETISSFTGKSTITDGKVEGDTVTFTIDGQDRRSGREAELQGQDRRQRDQVHQRDGRRRWRRRPSSGPPRSSRAPARKCLYAALICTGQF